MSVVYDASGWGSIVGGGESGGIILMLIIFGSMFLLFKLIDWRDSVSENNSRSIIDSKGERIK